MKAGNAEDVAELGPAETEAPASLNEPALETRAGSPLGLPGQTSEVSSDFGSLQPLQLPVDVLAVTDQEYCHVLSLVVYLI